MTTYLLYALACGFIGGLALGSVCMGLRWSNCADRDQPMRYRGRIYSVSYADEEA